MKRSTARRARPRSRPLAAAGLLLLGALVWHRLQASAGAATAADPSLLLDGIEDDDLAG